MLPTIMTIILVLASLVLIGSILLHSGKSAGLSGTIGGGAEQIWGKTKARTYDDMLDKVTKIAAIAFIISTITLVAVQ